MAEITNGIKHIAYETKFLSSQFNAVISLLWGKSARLRGFDIAPSGAVEVGPGTTAPSSVIVGAGDCLINGIVCEVPDQVPALQLPIVGQPPYAVVATTASDKDVDSIYISLVADFTPEAYSSQAILAYTGISGLDWTAAQGYGVDALVETLTLYKQLTDEELNVLTGRRGLRDAQALHGHAGLMDKVSFEMLTNLDFSRWPHKPKTSSPVVADSLHSHRTLLTDEELYDLTARVPASGANKNPDRQHRHKNALSDAQFHALVDGPLSTADGLHSHHELPPGLVLPTVPPVEGASSNYPQGDILIPGASSSVLGVHGAFVNSRPTLFYAPQNRGVASVVYKATKSEFEGSLQLFFVAVDNVVKVGGIRFKTFARFWSSKRETSFSGHPEIRGLYPDIESEVDLHIDTFGRPLEEGVTITDRPNGPVDLNKSFTWNKIEFYVHRPQTGPALDPDVDFFTANGIVMTTVTSTDPAAVHTGRPSKPTYMHERELSFAPLRLAPTLDERFPEGGFFVPAYQ